MADGVGETEQVESAMPAEKRPASHAEPSPISAKPRGRMLLPFYLANLAAIYLPSLLPLGLEVRRKLDEEMGLNLRGLVVDVLAAPWEGLRFAIDRGVLVFADRIGSAGSLYVFLLTLWIGTLLASILYCNDRRRNWLTFTLFVLSTVQAIFVAERFVSEQQQRPVLPQEGVPVTK